MGTLKDMLYRLAGFAPRAEAKKERKPKKEPDRFGPLSEAYLACGDEAQKAALWTQMCRTLPETLFLAAMCYEGEDPNTPVRDTVLHATVGARPLCVANLPTVTKGHTGYKLSKKDETRTMHLRSLVYNQTKEEWVPLFTDFTKMNEVFGGGTRVTLIAFDEARRIANPYCGLVINPGPEAVKLGRDALRRLP